MGINLTFRPKISEEEIYATLLKYNEVFPQNWFLVKNTGKDKKQIYGYILNETDTAIQLFPLIGVRKYCYIDSENITILDKNNDIEKITVAHFESYEIRLSLKNGFVYKLEAFPIKATKNHKQAMKLFRKEHKATSKKEQRNLFLRATSILLAASIVGGSVGYGYGYLRNQYIHSYALSSYVKSGELDEFAKIKFEPYGDKAELQLSGDVQTVTFGNIRLNIPDICTLTETSDDEIAIYSTGFDNDFVLTVNLCNEPLDFSFNFDKELDQKKKIVYEKLTDTCEREFGVPLDSYYNFNKALFSSLSKYRNDINYFNSKEVALYTYMIPFIHMMVTLDEVYDITTSDYCGFVKVITNEINSNRVHIVSFEIYSYDNLDLQYQVVIHVKNGDINDAYKIINSVELIK